VLQEYNGLTFCFSLLFVHPPCACGLSLAFIKPANAMWSRLQITKRPCRTVIAAVMVTAFEDASLWQGGQLAENRFFAAESVE
jgi:hypothetical protein